MRPSVCGNDLKPDIVMALRNKPCVPLTTAAIIDIKRQGGGYDNDENVGKAITYGRVFLQQLPSTLRKVVVVGLTDLLSITLIIVSLDVSDGSEPLSFDMSPRLPDVRYTLLQLLSSEPQRLFVELPDLGASIQVVGLLGFGASSHVYEVVEGGQQVRSSIVYSVELPASSAFFTIAISLGTKSAYVMIAYNLACGCRQHVCQDEQFCLQQGFLPQIVRMRSHTGSVQACMQDCAWRSAFCVQRPATFGKCSGTYPQWRSLSHSVYLLC